MSDKKNKMRIWDAVCKTAPEYTKKMTHGAKLTTICAYSQFQEATRLWGPYGEGWGSTVIETSYPPNKTVVHHLSFWYDGDKNKTIETFGQSDLETKYGSDSDSHKKAQTDGETKALSKLGFNADVFLGRFDDNNYIKARTQEEQAKFKKQTIDYVKGMPTMEDLYLWSMSFDRSAIEPALDKEISTLYFKTMSKLAWAGMTKKDVYGAVDAVKANITDNAVSIEDINLYVDDASAEIDHLKKVIACFKSYDMQAFEEGDIIALNEHIEQAKAKISDDMEFGGTITPKEWANELLSLLGNSKDLKSLETLKTQNRDFILEQDSAMSTALQNTYATRRQQLKGDK